MNHDETIAAGSGIGRADDTYAEFGLPASWGAVAGGAVAALSIQLVLTLLGVGAGVLMASPSTSDGAMGSAAISWMIVSGIVSFGIGGMVASCMSGAVQMRDGAFRGALAWALAAVFATAVSALAGSATLGGVASAAAAVAPMVDRVGIDSQPATPRNSTAAEASGADGSTADGVLRLSATEATIAAQRTADALAKASLWMGIAFALSLTSAAIGGVLGTGRHERTTVRNVGSRHASPSFAPRANDARAATTRSG